MRSILDAGEDARLSGRKCRLLLHACCGPCCAGALPQLADAFEVTLFFHNPNILPKEEFIKRFDALKLLLTHFEGVGLKTSSSLPSAAWKISPRAATGAPSVSR